jgi:predicted DNA-binding transcriptional regulator AlpA
MSNNTTKSLFRPAEVQATLGIGHSTFWKLVKEQKLETRKIGRATVVPAESLHRFVESLPKAAA